MFPSRLKLHVCGIRLVIPTTSNGCSQRPSARLEAERLELLDEVDAGACVAGGGRGASRGFIGEQRGNVLSQQLGGDWLACLSHRRRERARRLGRIPRSVRFGLAAREVQRCDQSRQ